MLNKKMTLGDVTSLIIDEAHILFDRDGNAIESLSLSFSGYETINDIPVKGIYADGGIICIVLDYKQDIIKELGIQDHGVQLSNMLAILIKSAQHIRVVETMNKTACTGDTIFSINKDGEINYETYFEYMLDKYGETAEDTAKAKAIREEVKVKIKEVTILCK